MEIKNINFVILQPRVYLFCNSVALGFFFFFFWPFLVSVSSNKNRSDKFFSLQYSIGLQV